MRYVELKNLHTVEVSGADAKKFLQGQITADLESINPTQASLAARCNLQGRVTAGFILFERDNNYWLITPSNISQTLFEDLTYYARFAKVNIQIKSEIKIFGLNEEKPSAALSNFPYTQFSATHHPNYSIIHLPGKLNRWLFISFAVDALQAYSQENQFTCTATSLETWQEQHIQSGIVLIDEPLSGKLLPQDIGYDKLNAVSFTKGCYMGQEIIARVHYRGVNKHQLAYVKWLTAPLSLQKGLSLFNINTQQLFGYVIDSLYLSDDLYSSSNDQTIGLITLPTDDQNQNFTISMENSSQHFQIEVLNRF